MSKPNSATIEGTVEHVSGVQEFASGFRKRQLVVRTGGDYPKTVPVDFLKDRAEMLDGLAAGDPVSVEVNGGGREYQGRYFADLTGWRINGRGAGEAPQGGGDEGDGMPF